MKTSETVETSIRVLEVKPRTFGNGKVGALLEITGATSGSRKILNDMGVDSILIDSVKEMNDSEIGKGSSHRISVGKNTGEVKFLLTSVRGESEKIVNCPSCRSGLQKDKSGDLFCVNYFCTANSLSNILILTALGLDATSLEIIVTKRMLQNFLQDGTTVSINNLTEFKDIFLQVREKNTASREASWEHIPDGKAYHEAEIKLEGVLKRKQVTCEEFWTVCNFPRKMYIDSLYFPSDLKNVNPRELLVGSGFRNITKLTANTAKLIEANLDFLILLLSVYDSYGEVEWITQ